MKKIDRFINLYPVSKTIRFKAIPIGKTLENIKAKRLLEEDEERAEKYRKAKKIIDRYHMAFIERVLKDVSLEGLNEYIELFNKRDRNEVDRNALLSCEASFRKQIAESFKKDKEYKSLFDKTLIEKTLPEYLKDEEEKDIISSFVGFKTAFEGYNQNRSNMYSDEEKSTAISFRCINDNLPRFISNMTSFEKIANALGAEILDKVAIEVGIEPYTVRDFFTPDFFCNLLSDTGINTYNSILGGLTTESGVKIQGINELINLHNQKLAKSEKEKRLPLLKTLYKQVLSERESLSYYTEGYKNACELLKDLNAIAGYNSPVRNALASAAELFSKFGEYKADGIFIKAGSYITDLSKNITGDWSTFRDGWNAEYDENNMTKAPKNMEKYEENRRKSFNSIDSFSVDFISKHLLTEEKHYSNDDITGFYSNELKEQVDRVNSCMESMKQLLEKQYKEERLSPEDASRIKEYLDSIKDAEKIMKPFCGSGKEAERDEMFYGSFMAIWDDIILVDSLYNRVRDFATSKPYSTDKYKLYFQNPQFMGGWDRNKVSDYRATILRKDGKYYIAVIDKSDSKVIDKIESCDAGDSYEILDYKLIPGASKQLPHIFFSGRGKETFKPSSSVLDIYEKGTFKKSVSGFGKDKCYAVIDYYKNAISKHEWSEVYNFSFSDTEDYEDISGFFREVDDQGYRLSFYRVAQEAIDRLVDEGKIYLFMLYNKDFSPNSHGTENLHTMLFKQVFNEDNNGLIKLCGGAELFFRKASIKKENQIVHPANQSIKNKNPLNPKKTSEFDYDLVKDKRYTVDQYEVHIPIQLNRVAKDSLKINDEVRKLLKEDRNPHVIGIDRGERNLLYICVVDGEGNIVEQESFNEIINEYKGTTIKTDYHGLLEKKEEERLRARQDWTQIENIKELKEGYISQVVHKICSLVIKYDAVIAMEDLNSGFKNSRVKVEKQVYQKFEKALVDKFNYMADKGIPIGENGSVIRAYQISKKFESFRSMGTQNGFIFYIPAWLTSKIDPVTGFADLLKPKYKSISEARDFIRTLDEIRYSKDEDMFIIEFDYKKFSRTDADFRKNWCIYTNGTRIKTFRNPSKNNEWDNQEIVLSDEFKNLFDKYGITYSGEDMRELLCKPEDKDFYVRFIELVKLTLQIRNSVTGRTDVDYLVSPVKDENGNFYDSRNADSSLPQDADANGAYNIARKVLWAIGKFKEAEDDEVARTKIAISNKEWLEYVQSKGMEIG